MPRRKKDMKEKLVKDDTDSDTDSDSDSDSEQSNNQTKIALGVGVGLATLIGAVVAGEHLLDEKEPETPQKVPPASLPHSRGGSDSGGSESHGHGWGEHSDECCDNSSTPSEIEAGGCKDCTGAEWQAEQVEEGGPDLPRGSVPKDYENCPGQDFLCQRWWTRVEDPADSPVQGFHNGNDYGYDNDSNGELADLTEDGNDDDCLLIFGHAGCVRHRIVSDALENIQDDISNVTILKIYDSGTFIIPSGDDFKQASLDAGVPDYGAQIDPDAGPIIIKRINGNWSGYHWESFDPISQGEMETKLLD